MCFDLDFGGRQASFRASGDLSERGQFAQIAETESYRNAFEEKPQSRQADKLGTRV